MVNNASIEDVRKAEVEALRKIAKQSATLLEKYGSKFDKDDRAKAIEIICLVNQTGHDAVLFDHLIELEQARLQKEETYARWIDDTKEQLLRKAQ